MPNQNVQANLMGVAVLAPDPNLFWGGGSGQNRVNGAAHAQAVNDLVKNVLPDMVAFNQSQVYFMGVSGGSLMMSGYFIPAQMQNYPNAGIMLACGAMAPQVPFQNSQAVIQQTRIHYQSK
jgi:predicted peptidase